MTGVKNPLRKRTKCKCPRCSKEFMRWTNNYTGREPARLFCDSCDQFKRNSDKVYSVDFELNTYGV